VSDSAVRVDVGLLDKLMTLVGELVLARNQILQYTSFKADPTLQAVSQRLNLITTELQEGMMQTRMQPIGNIWNKLPRMVRDLALDCGKQVRIEMEGEATELDKTLIEAIKDPLTHLVRNAVDHGIEPPDERLAAGKPAEGVLSLRAFHEGGQVNIEIQDDGAGIDPERIKRKAIEHGLVGPEQVARMSERELLSLIFLPGFSTAERLTLVSGRGVGMDVVKTGIEKIGGMLDMQSQRGVGTVIKVKIPLTLAIIKALIVSSSGDRYAIPQVSLLELVRLEGDHAHLGIEMFHGAPVHRYRGKLLPLVDLNHLLRPGEGTDPIPQDCINIVVLQADDQPFGLVVDRVSDAQEIVVRPLASQLKGIACFSGATIMGDGRIALILDVVGLGRQAGVIGQARPKNAVETVARPAEPTSAREALLLLRGTDGGRMAIPVGQVVRLEAFARSAVEDVGGRPVVPYRGQILPLIDVAATLPRASSPLGPPPRRAIKLGVDDTVPVVVCSTRGLSVGLVFERVLDIVEQSVHAQGPASRLGVLFTAVVGNHVTEVLDVEAVVRASGPGLGSTIHAQAQGV
jgi:two-component system chemotaxis sensor kinase CheA